MAFFCISSCFFCGRRPHAPPPNPTQPNPFFSLPSLSSLSAADRPPLLPPLCAPCSSFLRTRPCSPPTEAADHGHSPPPPSVVRARARACGAQGGPVAASPAAGPLRPVHPRGCQPALGHCTEKKKKKTHAPPPNPPPPRRSSAAQETERVRERETHRERREFLFCDEKKKKRPRTEASWEGRGVCRGGPCVRPALAREQKKRSGRGRKRKGETEGRHTHVLSERHTRLPRPAHARTSLSLQPRCAPHARPMHSQGRVRRPEGGIPPPPPPCTPRADSNSGGVLAQGNYSRGGARPPHRPHRTARPWGVCETSSLHA